MGIIEIIVVVLFGIFVYQKLNGQGDIAEWSWWRVTSPLWLYLLIIMLFPVILFGFTAFFVLIIGMMSAIMH